MIWLLLSIAALAQSIAIKPRSSEENSIHDAIQDLTNAVASSYFSEARCVAVITEAPSVYLRTSEVPQIYLTINEFDTSFDDLLLVAVDSGCLGFILQVKDVRGMVEKFSEIFHSPSSIYRANRRYLYLPLEIGTDEDSLEALMNDIFSCRSMNWMPDLLIVNLIFGNQVLEKLSTMNQIGSGGEELGKNQVVSEANFLLEVYTHRFVGETPSEKVFLDAWIHEYGFVYRVNLFYDKVSNLMGKELRMIALHYPPFTVMELDTVPPVLDGLEFQPMLEFGKKHNITWKVLADYEHEWGEIWDNGSGNGILGYVADDRAEFGFCALYLWTREYRYVDYSVPHYHSGEIAITPKPKPLPAWLLPARPFNIDMWYAVLASVIVVTIVLYVVSKSSDILLGGIASRYATLVECGFRTAGLLVLQIPDDERDYSTARYVPMRHLVTWIILYFLVVSSAYGGCLASILTLPQFQPPIDTAKELADSGMHWYANDESYVYSFRASTDPMMQTLTRNFRVLPEEELMNIAFDNVAFVVERLQGGHIVDVKHIFEKMMDKKRMMKEYMLTSHIVAVLRKGSPYTDNLNSVLIKLRLTGMQIFWEAETVRNYLSQRLQKSIISSNAAPQAMITTLTFSHVQGAFYILALGLCLSSVTFALELLRFRLSEKKKTMVTFY